MNPHGDIALNPLVDLGLDLPERQIRRIFGRDIDGAVLRAEVEGKRMDSIVLLEYRRQKVLPSVLLHVIEATLPIDTNVHAGTTFKSSPSGSA